MYLCRSFITFILSISWRLSWATRVNLSKVCVVQLVILNFLQQIVFAAVLGYAAAGALIAPVLGYNPGDAQAAAIDATVAAQDNARAYGEANARAAEAAVQYNTEAVRQAAETNRDYQQNAYWNGVAASQNYVAAAQSQAAAISGAAAAVRAAAPLGYAGYAGYAAPGYAGYAAPLAYAAPGLGYGAPLGAYGHGLRAW